MWVIIHNQTVILEKYESIKLIKLRSKKELDHTTGIDTSDLAAKGDFIALKDELEKLHIN